MCVAVQLDRRNIPAGIWRQKDMGSPNTRTSKPLIARKCAAADRAYGPAPTIATSHAVMVGLTREPATGSPKTGGTTGDQRPKVPSASSSGQYQQAVSSQDSYSQLLMNGETNHSWQLDNL